MADRTLPRNLYDEKILISLLINAPPNAVDEMAAARMFIEINAGGSDLNHTQRLLIITLWYPRLLYSENAKCVQHR